MFSKSIKWTCMCFVNIHGCSKFTIQPANWAPCLMENPMGSLGWSHEAPWNSQLSPDHHRTNETQVVIRVSSLPLDLERSVYVLHRSMIHIWGILFRDVTQRSDITISGAIQAHMDPDLLMHTKKIYPLVNYNLTLLWKIMTLSPSLLAVCQSVTCSSIAVFFGGDLGRFRRYQLLSSRENQQNPTRTSPSAFPPPKKNIRSLLRNSPARWSISHLPRFLMRPIDAEPFENDPIAPWKWTVGADAPPEPA